MPGLIRGVARTAAIAGTATAVSNRVSRRQAGRWSEQDQQKANQQQAYQEPPVYPTYQQPAYPQSPPLPPAPPPGPAPAFVAASPAEESDMDTKLGQLQ